MNELDRLEACLPEWVEASRLESAKGTVATYIPELSKSPKHLLGIHLIDAGGRSVSAGDAQAPFTMQSISKVFTLILALMDHGEEAVFPRWAWSLRATTSIRS